MICVSLANMTFSELLSELRHEQFAEIRLDKMELKPDQVEKIFSQPNRLIATCRPGKFDEETRLALLKKAIESGATYVDIEIEAPQAYLVDLVEVAKSNRCKVIISYHNFDETPEMDELIKITQMCFDFGADIAKVVSTVKNNADRAKILGLYASFKNIVAFGMGEMGKITRILAPLMGAEYTYASKNAGNAVAPGQLDKATMLEKIETLSNL